jgi:hypothetical protein
MMMSTWRHLCNWCTDRCGHHRHWTDAEKRWKKKKKKTSACLYSQPEHSKSYKRLHSVERKRFSHHNPHTPPSSTAPSQISSTQTQTLIFFLIITQFPNFSPLPKLLRTHRRE